MPTYAVWEKNLCAGNRFFVYVRFAAGCPGSTLAILGPTSQFPEPRLMRTFLRAYDY